MPILKVVLRLEEQKALQTLASHELRDPRAQAALIIRRELEQLELVPRIILNQDQGEANTPAKEVS